MWTQHLGELTVTTSGRGFTDVTGELAHWLSERSARDGLVTLFIRHTSASLVVHENADPEVRADQERFFSRLVADSDPLFRHDAEGPDDMPAHVRAVLTTSARGGGVGLGAPCAPHTDAPSPSART